MLLGAEPSILKCSTIHHVWQCPDVVELADGEAMTLVVHWWRFPRGGEEETILYMHGSRPASDRRCEDQQGL